MKPAAVFSRSVDGDVQPLARTASSSTIITYYISLLAHCRSLLLASHSTHKDVSRKSENAKEHPHGFKMSFLQNATLLSSIRSHDTPPEPPAKQPRTGHTLRSRGSIATLVSLVRNPVATVGEAVETWYGGLTIEERIGKQRSEDRKQVLYLRLRSVSHRFCYSDFLQC